MFKYFKKRFEHALQIMKRGRFTVQMKLKIITVVCITLFVKLIHRHNLITNLADEMCPSVLNNMVFGKWTKNTLTPQQKEEMQTFLDNYRHQIGLPKSLQRHDILCGNVTFPGQLPWFRALCDPDSETPCCFYNKCATKTATECHCEDSCFDLRQPIHAEYADWVPFDQRCKLTTFNHIEACELLKGKTLFISGDSFMRHLYTAFLLVFRNNITHGAMKEGVPAGILRDCSGMYMFTETKCRLQLDHEARGLCGGDFNLVFREFNRMETKDNFTSTVDALTKSHKTIIICGLGMHVDMIGERIANKYLLPVLNILQSRPQSKLVFAPPHCPGILKNTWNGQSKQEILRFTAEMETLLKPYKIPIFNTCPITSGVVSFDGSHYGLGLNLLKVQLLLNYIQELNNSEQK